MKPAVLQKIALHSRNAALRPLPPQLGRKAGPGPAGECVSFVVTDMANRLGLFNFAHAGTGELDPRVSRFLIAGFLPVKRRFPAIGLHGFPSVREPEFRTRITAIFHERKIFTARGQAHAEPKRTQENFVPRAFIVEIKRFAVRADLVKAFRIKLRLLLRRAFSRSRSNCWLIRRIARGGPKT